MKFEVLAKLFESLENTSKRLEKILILRDFAKKNEEEMPLVFDIIAGNYQRRINKKTIGISLKTIFSVISFVSKVPESKVEREFNKIGDVGQVAEKLIITKQQSLLSSQLKLESILMAFESISEKTGKNSNKRKKEILSQLFLQAKTPEEYRFLSRLLIDDLRIGVSEGVLKEAYVNYFFPVILGIHKHCQKCSYVNLNLEKCFNCSEKLNPTKKETNVISKEDIEKSKKIPDSKAILKTDNPRELYNYFLSLFELKYNLINSFELISKKLEKNQNNIFHAEIEPGQPLRSMLGPRVDSIKNAYESTGKPALLDYKYDGLRLQIHNDKGEVKLFSRNLEEITKQFPEIVEFIKENFSDCSFVVDSEGVGFDFNKKKFLPFQVLSRRIMTKKVDTVSHINVVVKLFDLLYLDGKTLINLNYEKRRELLEEMMIGRELKQNLHFDLSSFENN